MSKVRFMVDRWTNLMFLYYADNLIVSTIVSINFVS